MLIVQDEPSPSPGTSIIHDAEMFLETKAWVKARKKETGETSEKEARDSEDTVL